jgi:hypothetical protein
LKTYMRKVLALIIVLIACVTLYAFYTYQQAKASVLKVFPDEDFLFEVLKSRGDLEEEDLLLVNAVVTHLPPPLAGYVKEKLCRDRSEHCVRLALVSANHFIKKDSQRHETLVSNLVTLSHMYYESAVDRCPIAHELSKLNIAVVGLRSNKENRLNEALELLRTINAGNGFDFSIVSDICQSSFDKHVLEYQGYMGLLAEVYLYSDQIDASSFLLSFKNIERFLSTEFQLAQ